METKTCQKCGKEFSKPSSSSYEAWNKRIYCSRRCYLQKRSEKVKYIPCQNCGKIIKVYGKKYSHGRTKYCSLKCRDEDWKDNSPIGGKKHWNWKGKTKISGYIYLKSKNHPSAVVGGYVAEHRLVMERELGRYLTVNEEVHHKNGVKDDNRIENLEMVIKKQHFGRAKCPYCLKEFKVK